ncbi:hypothetical protein JCM17846_29560 [Iodidimonas nitroreducens]|uniref:Endonuclease/exonuclease/phosphatase domain-containing protein n=1 Tax=Iodidimonas nitroreducens TaxID=1236968 RepID=A0A5A7NC43_9PROT|nr:endonuclease/exonuclease/phosphatase family protein [Iodidimonas nitroreducens]GER05274.1 hypothetical protein JCM17846_29560 [Iodidimonas nitroreducens]
MKIASFNINGVKARLPRLLEWLEGCKADVVCLQELKSLDENFPRLEFEDRGWHLELHGQKGFNGVALLSRAPLHDVRRGLPGMEDDPQARYIEGRHDGVLVARSICPMAIRPPALNMITSWISWSICAAMRPGL